MRKLSRTIKYEVYKRYLMMLPIILMVLTLIFFDLSMIGIASLSPLFFMCYAYFFLGIAALLDIVNRRTLIIPGTVLMAVVLLLISRDMILTVNVLAALASVYITLLAIDKENIRNRAFPIFVLVNVILSLIFKVDNRVIIICLIVGCFYSLGTILKKEVDYRFAVVLILLLTCLLPIREEPIMWTPIVETLDKISYVQSRAINEIGYQVSSIFNIKDAFTGYSDVAELGGLVKEASREELLFQKTGKVQTLYLKGADYRTLTNKGLEDKETFSSDYNQWLVQFLNAMKNADVTRPEAICFIKIERAEVQYEYLRTEDIIRPGYLLQIDDSLEDGLDKRVGKGFSYKIQYMAVDYASPYYLKFIETVYGEDFDDTIHSYTEIKDYADEILNINISKFMSEETYNEAATKLTDGTLEAELQNYLDTSMTTDKITELSQSLTEDCQNNYEKAKVIEAYIRQYSYDRSVDLRRSDNFIEDYLFDVKKGYCVHSASAMMLLLRDAGVPARYSSGYLYKVKDKTGTVLSNEAHAWVEAYIEGIGWMTFEPTVNAKASEELAWGLVAKKEKSTATGTDPGEYEYQMPDVDYAELYGGAPGENGDVTTETDHGLNREIVKRTVIYGLILIGSAAGLLLIIFLGKKIWFYRLSPEKKLQEIVKKTCRNIEKDIESEEDRMSLQKNIASIYDYIPFAKEEERERLKKLFDLYYLVRFRGDEITEQDLKI